MLDQNHHNETIGLYREKVTTETIVSILQNYRIPKQFDLFSLDVDFSDFWLMRRILAANYRPRVIIVEVCFTNIQEVSRRVILGQLLTYKAVMIGLNVSDKRQF